MAVGVWAASDPAGPWQPTQICIAGPALPRPSATTPCASCGAGLSSGTRSYQYQLAPLALSDAVEHRSMSA